MKNFFKTILIYLLRVEARLVIWKYKPKIIAITGSVGKTSTKDAVYSVLSGFHYVRKSDKSYNSEIGLPLTVLGCPNGWTSPYIWASNLLKGLSLIFTKHKYPEWLVLEVGVGKAGDMKRTASWLQTDVVVITAIGETPVHIEFFNSRKHLIEEKAELINTLKFEGLLVLNQDDDIVLEMKNKTKCKTITYGFSDGAAVKAEEENFLYDDDGSPLGLVFRIGEDGNSLPVTIKGVLGKNHIYSSLAALAVAQGLKLNPLIAINQLDNYETPPGRMKILKGINESTIIDDTYNSSPLACQSALLTLSRAQGAKRKVVALGDMLELGKHTDEEHEKIGEMASKVASLMIVVGQRAKKIKEGAVRMGMKEENIFDFLDSAEAGEFLTTKIKEGDLILVKGSQGLRMEKTVAKIIKDKRRQNELLVRQDEEWLKR